MLAKTRGRKDGTYNFESFTGVFSLFTPRINPHSELAIHSFFFGSKTFFVNYSAK
jgi:hypothetical protein